MRSIPLAHKGMLAVLVLLLSLPGCILVVDDDYDDDLRHSRWRLDVIVYYGRTYAVDAPYSLYFDSNNQLSGSADCNDYDGDYEVSLLGTISVRDLYTTDVACSRSLEDLYFDALYSAFSYSVQGDALTIKGRGGEYILYFYRT